MKTIFQKFSLITLALFTYISLLGSTNIAESIHLFKQEQESRNMHQYGLVSTPKEKISFNFPSEMPWKKSDFSEEQLGTVTTYIPDNESAYNTSQSIQTKVIPYKGFPGISAKKLMQIEMENVKEYCQNVSMKIISQSTQSIIYQSTVIGCGRDGDLWQIEKVFNGKDAVYSVRYSAAYENVSKDQRMQASHTIKSARLVY